jgi:DNA-binding MarR family transcriptional regulator
MSIQQRIQQCTYRSPSEHAFVSLLFVAGELVRRLEETCERQGLTHTQYNVLRILRGVYPEGHARCQIIERMVTRAPDVTRLLDRLEKRGWIARGWSKENRRLSIATITQSGLDLLKTLDPEMERIQHEMVGALNATQLEQLCVICDRIIEAQEQESQH